MFLTYLQAAENTGQLPAQLLYEGSDLMVSEHKGLCEGDVKPLSFIHYIAFSKAVFFAEMFRADCW